MDPTFKAFGSADFDPVAFASVVVDADSKSQASSATALSLDIGGRGGGGGQGAPGGGAAEAAAAGVAIGRVSRAELTMAEMSGHVGLIDGAIQSHIQANRQQLLGGVGGLHELQADVAGLATGVAEVKRATGRISRDLGQPFETLKAKAAELRRVASASVLLRRVLRVQMTTRRLRALEPGLGLGALPAVIAGTANAALLADVSDGSRQALSACFLCWC
jgi:hypothetical protein